MSLGLAIGAITFSGSLIAFAKLQGDHEGRAADLPEPASAQSRARRSCWCCWSSASSRAAAARSCSGSSRCSALALGFLLIMPIGGADMPVVVSMLNSYSGWAACGIGFTIQNTRADHHRRAGRRLRRDPVLHHVQGHEPQHHQRAAGRVRLRGGRGGRPAARRSTARSDRATRRTPRSS